MIYYAVLFYLLNKHVEYLSIYTYILSRFVNQKRKIIVSFKVFQNFVAAEVFLTKSENIFLKFVENRYKLDFSILIVCLHFLHLKHSSFIEQK